MRSKASRWRLFQYPTCWRNSRFSRRKRSTSARNSTTSRLEFSTGSINSGEEPLGQQTCTSWPFMTNLVYRDGRDLGRGGFPFIHYRQTCTDGIGEALPFHFAAERDLRLSFNDALTKLSGHLLGIVTVQIQLVSNLFVREIQPHNCPAISRIASSGYADHGLTLAFFAHSMPEKWGFSRISSR